MEMDLTSMMVVAEGVSQDGSYSAWHGAHTGIGTLPLLMFGTEEQKQSYLPKLATAEMVAAYCLSEPQAGSDALAARTRADLSRGWQALHPQRPEDVDHQRRLRGSLHRIRQSRRREVHGVSGGARMSRRAAGAEEKKMGIKGSSTTAVYFDNVKVPVENVLGEIGRGHIIAFNILNIGRLKLGPFALGGASEVLRDSIQYAKERKAFGKSISRIRDDPAQAGGNGDPDFREREHDLSRGGVIEASWKDFRGSAGCRQPC